MIARILLTVAFFVVVLPGALLLRVLGRDPMRRRFDAGAKTYRNPSPAVPKDALERQS